MESAARLLVERQDRKTLLENDQLCAEVCHGGTFQGRSEGPITFSSTYKYYPTPTPTMVAPLPPGATASVTSGALTWCDRIL